MKHSSTISTLAIIILMGVEAFAQDLKDTKQEAPKNAKTTTIGKDSGNIKTYVFVLNTLIKECNGVGGNILKNEIIAYDHMQFTVEDSLNNGDLIIKFNTWIYHRIGIPTHNSKERLKYREIYNYKTKANKSFESVIEGQIRDNVRFFLLKKSDFLAHCKLYTPIPFQKWDASLGILTLPFKIRSNPFNFAPNLSLGSALYIQRKFRSGFSTGVVVGISLSSVTLDSASTKGVVKTSGGTSRPALTPSVQGLLAFKSINVTFGFGWDIINCPTQIEKNWVYQKKPWFGIGIGVNLFNSNTSSPVPADSKQKSATK